MQFMGVSQFGVYRLEKLLGQGSFSEVYLAEHATNRTKFAIKMFYQQLASEGEKSEFLEEVGRLAKLKHPNIIKVVEFGVENRIPFVVMDYAPYGNLREIHAKGAIVPITTVIEHVKSIAAALEYLHYHKFVHRHLEPEKVLVGRNNTLLGGGSVRSLAWAPQTAVGPYMVSGGNDKTVHIWNARDGEKVIIYKGHTARINAVSWSPDGRFIASASEDGTVQIWTAP